MLIQKGANVNQSNNDGQTALALAEARKDSEIIRLLHEARAKTSTSAQQGTKSNAGEAVRQPESNKRPPSPEVEAAFFKDYDRKMSIAIRKSWHAILEQTRTPTRPGKVVITFRQYSNGRVDSLKVNESNVGDSLAVYCQMAVSDPSPYEKWPSGWRDVNTNGHRDITFAFDYDF
jgi:ankyrin repeat protein